MTAHFVSISAMASADAFAGGGPTTVRVIWAMQARMTTQTDRTALAAARFLSITTFHQAGR